MTTIKNNKLLSKEYLKYISSLKIGLNPLFIDESGFKTKNDHFYTWRKKNKEIYNAIEDNKKVILLIRV